MRPLIELRRARLTDESILFSWRNDPITRESFVNGNPVTWDEHFNWINKAIYNKNCKLLVAEDGGKLVGTIRIDYQSNGSAELSWNVAPEHRGCRYGTEMLRQVCQLEPKLMLVAKIKPTNIASAHMAMSCGFWFDHEEGELLVFTRLGK